jgi:predicted PurR-regulated permease PerM
MMRRYVGVLQPRLLNRIAWLLFALVFFLALAFCYFASSVCITLLLGVFIAVLVDPVVTYLQRLGLPRTVSAGLTVVCGVIVFCTISYLSYGRVSMLVENMPRYSSRIRDVITPVAQKIAKVQETAVSLNTPETSASKKVAEVKIRETPTWPSFIIRGVAPVWGAIIIIGVVPFLVFFNLVRRDQMQQMLSSSFGGIIDVPKFSRRVTSMVRGYAVGNLLIGAAMAVVTITVLLAIKLDGALILGIVSGFLNLIPFLGVILAALVLLAAALLQFSTAGPFVVILLTVVTLHVISANYLIPKIVGSRVNIGPVAATGGILFWGWLWGVMGVLLAIPLTAFVKIVADSHPSLVHISNILAEHPRVVTHPAKTAEETTLSTYSTSET